MAELKERYARALLELSDESGMVEKHIKEAAFIHDSLNTLSGEAMSFLNHPSIPDKAKLGFFKQLFDDKVSDIFTGFLYLTVEKSREAVILPTLQTFIDMANRKLGKVSAIVVSAAPLRKEQISTLQKLLSSKMNKQVGLETKVDPAVIGGMYIQFEERLIDRTVRTQLKNLKEIVKKGVLNDS